MWSVLRRPIGFAAAFLPIATIAFWLYPHVVPAYERAAIAVANQLLRLQEPRFEIAIDRDGTWIASEVGPGGTREPVYGVSAVDRHLLYLSLPLLPALLLATPVLARRRLTLGVSGLALLFPLHVLVQVGLVRVNLCLDADPGSFLCTWGQANLASAGQVFTVLLWVLLTFPYWIRPRGDVDGPAKLGRREAGEIDTAVDVPARGRAARALSRVRGPGRRGVARSGPVDPAPVPHRAQQEREHRGLRPAPRR